MSALIVKVDVRVETGGEEEVAPQEALRALVEIENLFLSHARAMASMIAAAALAGSAASRIGRPTTI